MENIEPKTEWKDMEEVNLKIKTEYDFESEPTDFLEVMVGEASNYTADEVKRNSVQKNIRVCDVCGKIFGFNSDLKRHIETVHRIGGKKKPTFTQSYKDEVADYAIGHGIPETIVKYGILKSTIERWRMIRKNPFPCEHCGIVLGYKSELERHIKARHDVVKRQNCTQSFMDEVADYAIAHGVSETIHKYGIVQSTIERWRMIRRNPLPCEQCGKVFGYKSELAKHMNAKHDDLKRPSFTQSLKDEVADYAIAHGVPEASKKYGIVKATIERWRMIRKKPIPCEHCGMLFGYKSELAKHFKARHDVVSDYALGNGVSGTIKTDGIENSS